MAVYTNRAYDLVDAAFVRWNTATPDTAGASYPGLGNWGDVSDYTIERVSQTAGVTDHGALLGLSDDDHSIYTLLAGRAGGQALFGGTVAGNTITIRANSADAPGVTAIVVNDNINMSTRAITGLGNITSVLGTISDELQVNEKLVVTSTSGGDTAAIFNSTDGDAGQPVVILVSSDANSGSNPGTSGVYVGNRTPESNVDADFGSLYVRTGDASSTLYVKQTATGTLTGWVDLTDGGAATSLQGVPLHANVGTPATGAMLYYNGGSYVATGALVTNGVIRDSTGVGWGLLENANIDAAAAIAGTKIDPDFGSQGITTTGGLIIGSTITAGSGDPLVLTTTGAGAIIVRALGTGDVDVDSVGGSTTISTAGNTRISLANDGEVSITAGSTKVLDITAQGAAGIIAIDAQGDEIQLSHAGGITRVTGDLHLNEDVLFLSTGAAPTITQTAVTTLVGKTMSLLAQSNNSTTHKAGNLVIAPGENANTGADGDLTLGLGITAIEISDNNEIGFFGVTPVSKPAITGARDTPEAALANLLTELATLGLITNSTTAS